MKRIKLSRGMWTLIYDKDFEIVSKFKRHCVKGLRTFYAFSRDENRKSISMHRFLLKASKGQIVDHINRNGLDNRRSNLRFCDKKENAFNSPKQRGNYSSKFKGVSFLKSDNRWIAQICAGPRMKNGESQCIYLGCFLNEEKAAICYDKAALKYFGEFAYTNFPKENYL